jgi:CHAT domain
MPGRTYTDFILITRIRQWNPSAGKRTFTVEVFDSPAGQQTEPCEVEIPDYEQLQEQVGVLEDRGFDGNLAAQRELGTLLADLLLPVPVREFFHRSMKRLAGSSAGLRLRLRLEPQLADLPWEFLYLPRNGHGAGGFLALDPRLSIVRHETLPIPSDWPEPGKTLHVVLAMASPEPYNTYQPLTSLPAEQLEIRGKVGKVQGLDLTCLPPYASADYQGAIPGATLHDLEEALQQRTDILQFSGHGKFEVRSGRELDTEVGKSFIILAGEANQAHEVSAGELASLVDGKGVRLLFLSACETAKRRPYKDAEGFTFEVLKHRIPCVLAMQFRVGDEPAAFFASTFYQALVAGWTVDEAVSQGRAAMVASGRQGRFAIRDWGAPVLYSRVPGGELFRPVLDGQARQEAERMAEQRSRLSQAWWGWNGRDDTLATAGQLRNLEEGAAKIELSPYQFLFLLRSAAREGIPSTPWLDRLRQGGQQVRAWLARLDDPRTDLPADLPEAVTILGLGDPTPEACPAGVGRVAWSAVDHPQRLTRQTAALALVSGGPEEGVGHIEQALNGLKGAPLRRWSRRSELYGTLVELDPGHAPTYLKSLPPAGRAGVWGWRMARQIRREAVPILGYTVGGALGAGLAIALERLLVGIFAYSSYLPASFFTLYSYFGFLLGLGLSFGRALAYFARLGGASTGPVKFFDRFTVRSIVLSTLWFVPAFWLISWVSALFQPPPPWGMAMGLAAGLSLGISMLGLPPSRPKHPLLSWASRIFFGALAFLIPQWVDKGIPVQGAGTVLAMTRAFFDSEYIQWEAPWWQIWIHTTPQWSEILNQVEAALFGLSLAVGMALGWLLADRWLAWWRKVTDRTDPFAQES